VTAVILVGSVFLACLVESVEALTIILAAGVSRGWRSALQGAGAGFVVLALIVAVLGPALTVIPLSVLRVLVGGLLLVFGLQWIRKAVLRASGYKGLHVRPRCSRPTGLTPTPLPPAGAARSRIGTGSPSRSRVSCSKGWRSRSSC